jgi:alanine-glyoxylate transaminase/serine-glyoxylate transaminase/serine-pyruvate transaminase
VAAWGLKLATKDPQWTSDTVTAVMVPPGFDSGEVVKLAWKKYNLSLGVGLNNVKGKLFRIGHLGSLNEVRHSRAERRWAAVPRIEK